MTLIRCSKGQKWIRRKRYPGLCCLCYRPYYMNRQRKVFHISNEIPNINGEMNLYGISNEAPGMNEGMKVVDISNETEG